MATISVNVGSTFLIDGANTYLLSGSTDKVVATYVIHLVSDSFSGSVSVKARAASAEAQADEIDPVAVNYLKVYVNGAIGDNTYGDAAITDTSLILVPATGQQIVLDCSSYTSGTMKAYCTLAAGL